jgi:hypothetical protein
MMARPTGRSMAVVAVLLTHKLRKAALARKPSTTSRGRPRAARRTSAAITRCRSLRWMPIAIRKPPRNRKMTGSP